MLDDILADIPREGEEKEAPEGKLDEQETETLEASPANEKTEVAESSSSSDDQKENEAYQDVPFHKHPRFKRLVEERNELKEAVEDLSRFKEETEGKLEELGKKPTPTSQESPQWFKEVFGDNQEAWNKFSDYDKSLRDQIKQEIFGELDRVQSQQVEQQIRWNNWVDTQIENVSQTFDQDLSNQDGKNTVRNEFLAFMVKNRPTNEEGNLDFLNGWGLFQEVKTVKGNTKTESTKARKEVLAQTTETKKTERQPKDYETTASLRNKGWTDIVKGVL